MSRYATTLITPRPSLQLEAAAGGSGAGPQEMKRALRYVATLRRLHEGCALLAAAAITTATLAIPCVAISSTQASIASDYHVIIHMGPSYDVRAARR